MVPTKCERVEFVPPPLHDFLRDADLLEYHDKLKSVLKLRHAGDLAFCEECDLRRVGMTRPEQKRLRFEFARRFAPPTAAGACSTSGIVASSSFQPLASKDTLVVKLRKKVFGGGGNVRDSAPYSVNGLQTESDFARRLSDGFDLPQQHVIPAECIHLCKELGRGEFGCVYQAAWHYRITANRNDANAGVDDVLQVAVKRVLPGKLVANSTAFLQEAAIMTRMRHENVIRLYGVVLDVRAVMMVSELAPCGSLLECLRCPAWREPFPVDALADFALQIARGMRYLAAQRLIHRDLAARNVLVASPTKVKISDFGLSRSLGVGEDYYRSEACAATARLPIAWCAPEAIKLMRFTSASDVWAYGVTLWEMFTYGGVPWDHMTGMQILMAVDVERRVLPWPNACPEEFYALMRDCWAHDVDARPTFDALCARLPDIMPQLLMCGADSAHAGDLTYLPHKRGDIIVLLRKSALPNNDLERSASRASSRASLQMERDNSLWLGALRYGGGLVGHFQPEQTVAYMGGDYYRNASAILATSTTMTTTTIGGLTDVLLEGGGDGAVSLSSCSSSDPWTTTSSSSIAKANGQQAKKSKILSKFIGGGGGGGDSSEAEKERRKLLISPPQGELRHIGHLGVDGQHFGMKNLFPALGGCGSSANQFTTNATTPTPRMEDENEADASAPPRPPTAMPRRQRVADGCDGAGGANSLVSAQFADGNGSRGVSSPALPPKTFRRIAPPSGAEQSKASEAELDEHIEMLQAEAKKRPNSTTKLTNLAITIPAINGEISHKTDESNNNNNNSNNCQDGETTDAGANLNRILYNLQRDISDFSLDTAADASSDCRPLLEHRARLCSPLPPAAAAEAASTVRAMTAAECERWQERVAHAHKKAAQSLERERLCDAQKRAPPLEAHNRLFNARIGRASPSSSACAEGEHGEANGKRENCANERINGHIALRGPFTSKYLSNNQLVDEGWSEEAQAAYKHLVQIGDRLRATSVSPKQNGDKMGMEESNLNPQKTIEYINPRRADDNENEENDDGNGRERLKPMERINNFGTMVRNQENSNDPNMVPTSYYYNGQRMKEDQDPNEKSKDFDQTPTQSNSRPKSGSFVAERNGFNPFIQSLKHSNDVRRDLNADEAIPQITQANEINAELNSRAASSPVDLATRAPPPTVPPKPKRHLPR